MKLLILSARHKVNGTTQRFFYKSLRDAQKHNPDFENWIFIGYVRDKK